MRSETIVKLATKLYEARNSFKALWGDKWREKLAPYSQYLAAGMTKHHCESLHAAMLIVKDLQANCPDNSHGVQLGILAAAVEDMEPTPREEAEDAK